MPGQVVKLRSVVEYTAADRRVFTLFLPGPDGKDIQTMKITYTRRK